MEPDRWTPIGRADAWPQPGVRVVQLGARKIAVWRLADGSFRALKDHCPHRGVILSNGTVADGQVACRAHGWRFDLASGACTHGDAAARAVAYAVRVRDGEVELGA